MTGIQQTDLDTRESIMDHAAKLFSARGYDAVSVREIVAASGVTKPALYYHFGSKEGLARALVKDFFARADATRAHVFESTEGVRELLEAYTREMLTLAKEYRHTLAFAFSIHFGRSSLKELIQDTEHHHQCVHEDWVKTLKARGLSERKAEVTRKAYWAFLMHELMRVSQCPDWRGCADSLADEMATLVLHGTDGFDEGTHP